MAACDVKRQECGALRLSGRVYIKAWMGKVFYFFSSIHTFLSHRSWPYRAQPMSSSKCILCDFSAKRRRRRSIETMQKHKRRRRRERINEETLGRKERERAFLNSVYKNIVAVYRLYMWLYPVFVQWSARTHTHTNQ